MRYVLSPLMVLAGIAIVRYSFWITNQTGKIDFAEKYFTAPLNGTYTWWRLVGLLIIALGVAWLFGYISFGDSALQINQ